MKQNPPRGTKYRYHFYVDDVLYEDDSKEKLLQLQEEKGINVPILINNHQCPIKSCSMNFFLSFERDYHLLTVHNKRLKGIKYDVYESVVPSYSLNDKDAFEYWPTSILAKLNKEEFDREMDYYKKNKYLERSESKTEDEIMRCETELIELYEETISEDGDNENTNVIDNILSEDQPSAFMTFLDKILTKMPKTEVKPIDMRVYYGCPHNINCAFKTTSSLEHRKHLKEEINFDHSYIQCFDCCFYFCSKYALDIHYSRECQLTKENMDVMEPELQQIAREVKQFASTLAIKYCTNCGNFFKYRENLINHRNVCRNLNVGSWKALLEKECKDDVYEFIYKNDHFTTQSYLEYKAIQCSNFDD